MNKSDPDRMESIADEERGTDRTVAGTRRAGTGEVRAVGSWFDDEEPMVRST